MEAAEGAATAALPALSSHPWAVLCAPPVPDDLAIRQAALTAALPIVGELTSDPHMAAIVAHGMVEEAMIRLRKRGQA
jgi:hypothetical protein